jgi:hypothetical protein
MILSAVLVIKGLKAAKDGCNPTDLGSVNVVSKLMIPFDAPALLE